MSASGGTTTVCKVWLLDYNLHLGRAPSSGVIIDFDSTGIGTWRS